MFDRDELLLGGNMVTTNRSDEYIYKTLKCNNVYKMILITIKKYNINY